MQTILLTFDSEGRLPVLDIAQPNPRDVLISVQGRSNQEIVLQNSTNLQNWFPLATNTLGSSPWVYQAELGKWGPRQYFRGVRP
jgi:hypothetical protein